MTPAPDDRCGTPNCGHPYKWHHGPSEYPGTALLCCEGSCDCRNYTPTRAEVRAS